MSALPKRTYTLQEYLSFERSSSEKHEYCNGEIFRMAEASNTHNIININVIGALRRQTRGGNCRVYANDMRTRVPTGLYTYPDILIVCGKPEFLDDVFDTLYSKRFVRSSRPTAEECKNAAVVRVRCKQFSPIFSILFLFGR